MSTLVVTSHESNLTLAQCLLRKCVFALPVCMGPHPHNQLNAKDTDVEKALLSFDITTKVLVK